MYKKFAIALLLASTMCFQAKADNCSGRTGNNATVILPAEVTSALKNGDTVRAYYKSLCVGQAVYQEGRPVAVAVWGDDRMTNAVDGNPDGRPFTFSVIRDSDTPIKLDVALEGGKEMVYERDGIYIAERIEVEGQEKAAQSVIAVANIKASSDDGNRPVGAIDGDLSTRWSAKGTKQWLRLDLGQPRQLGEVEIAWYRGDERKALFEIEASADGRNWRQVFSGTSSGRTTGPERYAVAAKTRFVRIVGRGNTENRWNSISEIKLYGPSTDVGSVLAVAGATASSHDGNRPVGAIDGDLSTRWSAKGTKQWLRLDLGQPRQLGEVEIAWYRGDERKALFEIEASADGRNWRQVFSGTSSGRTTGPERYAVAAKTRFVRIVGRGNTENRWNSISEIQLYAGDPIQLSSAALGGGGLESAKGSLLETAEEMPTAYGLDKNYPNPFNPSTVITYRLPKATKVKLTVYNVSGQRIAELVDKHQEAGEYQIQWDGRDAAGAPVGSGLYAYQIKAGNFRESRTMMLLK